MASWCCVPIKLASVWRILQTPNTLLGHVVGAGKTYTMVAAGMELRRLGFYENRFPAVPEPHARPIFIRIAHALSGRNILVASKAAKTEAQNLDEPHRHRNWDAVIVTHSGFEKDSFPRKTQEEFLKSQLRELALAIEEQRGQENSRIVKELERAKKNSKPSSRNWPVGNGRTTF